MRRTQKCPSDRKTSTQSPTAVSSSLVPCLPVDGCGPCQSKNHSLMNNSIHHTFLTKSSRKSSLKPHFESCWFTQYRGSLHAMQTMRHFVVFLECWLWTLYVTCSVPWNTLEATHKYLKRKRLILCFLWLIWLKETLKN